MRLPKRRKECCITEEIKFSDKTVENKEICNKKRLKKVILVKLTKFRMNDPKM